MARHEARAALRDVLLDQEERLSDLRAALAALSLISSAYEGIEKDDMAGLRYVTTNARALADALHGVWKDAVQRLDRRAGPAR